MQPRLTLLALVLFGLQSACDTSSEPHIQVDATRTVAFDATGHMRLLSMWANRIPVELLRSPLYHDEQRIHIGKLGRPDEFGSRVAIAATRDLAALDDNSFADWVSVAMLNVERDDEGTEHSKLDEGYSCIYVRRRGNHWQGLMKPSSSTACPEAPINTTGIINNIPRYTRTDGQYPGAVRLEMSKPAAIGWKYWLYPGVRCGQGWCTISRATVDLPGPKGTTNQELVPGWHDEQFLSYEKDNLPWPSRIRARLIPNEKLLDEVGTEYVDVAYMDTDGNDDTARDKYRDKWNLNYWEPGQRITIGLKRIISVTPQKTDTTYYVRLVAGSETSEFIAPHISAPIPLEAAPQAMLNFYGARGSARAFAPIDIPGTVRLAWYEAENGIWLRCDNGCCTVN